ncbi:MAG: flagellar motor switch protein FliG [Deltaproteobacteria bacterium]|nr:flagellar motor switch protein FliG [Deltaproteobacteria bacterium]
MALSPDSIEQLNGPQKTAVLLLSMGEKFAVEVFKRMERQEIVAISKAMAELDAIPKEVVEGVLREFHHALVTGQQMVRGGNDAVRKLMLNNVDQDTAKYITDLLHLDAMTQPFRELGNVSPKLMAQILRNEHPQTLSLILGHLPPDRAGELLVNMPAGVRTEVLIRLARLEAVPEEMLVAVDKVLQSQIIAMGGKEGRKVGGVQAVAEILNAVDRATEEEVMSEIEEESAQMAEDIRALMFVFDDVKTLDDKAIRELLKEITTEDMIMALRGANDEMRDVFFRNMSERQSNMIREDLEIMGPTRLSDVEAAQMNVIKAVRKLEGEGRIIVSRGSGEVFI